MSDIEGSDESSNIVDIENFISASCEDKVILKILNNEQAMYSDNLVNKYNDIAVRSWIYRKCKGQIRGDN